MEKKNHTSPAIDYVNGQEIDNEEKVIKGPKYERRMTDLLDIQLLLAVIVLFVSAWAYLNNVICDFTTAEPFNERMAYILVHYILSAVLLLCLGITYIKGKYLLITDRRDFSIRERKYIDLFIYGWIWVLCLCVCILVFSNFYWWIGGLAFLIGVCLYMFRENFDKAEIAVVNSLLVLCFPVFISLMTNITKNIEIEVAHDTITDVLTITVNPRSYDAEYIVKGLANSELVKGEQYMVYDHVINTKNAYIHNNEIVVSVVSPASGSNFWDYAIRKILNYDLPKTIPNDATHYNKTKIVNID